MGWAEWEACSNGERVRSQQVLTMNVGAGKECPELTSETEGMINC